jgi:hypothetical protein
MAEDSDIPEPDKAEPVAVVLDMAVPDKVDPDTAGPDTVAPDRAVLAAESGRTVFRRQNKKESRHHWAYYNLNSISFIIPFLFLFFVSSREIPKFLFANNISRHNKTQG